MRINKRSPFIGCAAVLLVLVAAARADDSDDPKAAEPWSPEQREVVEAERFNAPKIWDEKKLADWDLPRAHQGLRENYVSEADYYGSPAYNTRTYPVYDPRKEPAGYWEWLHTLEPEPLVEPGLARTRDEWIRSGRMSSNNWIKSASAWMILKSSDIFEIRKSSRRKKRP